MRSKLARRDVLRAGAALGAVSLSGMFSAVSAQSAYPTKPITLVVPLAAGTGMDTIARLYSDRLTQSLGKPVVADNRPGAGMMLATASVATAPPDGYTLLIATSGAFAINPVMHKKISYDPDKDFVPIALYVKSPFVLIVNPALPVHSVADLIALAKSSPTPLTYSTPGVGLMQHLSAEFMKARFGFEATHVPYRSTPQSVTDIAAGHVSMGFAEAGASVPLIREGKVRALAVSSTTRLGVLPEVPPFAEAANAPDFEAVSWHLLLAPAGTPGEIVDRLRSAMKVIMAAPDMTKRVSDLGLIPYWSPTEDDIRAYIKSEQAKWGSLVRQLGLAGSQ